MSTKDNRIFIIGLLVPIILILLFVGSIYLPVLFIHPQSDFLYVSDNDDEYGHFRYFVKKGHLDRIPVDRRPTEAKKPHIVKLYLYENATNSAKHVSFEAAQKLLLNTNPLSPNGFQVTRGNYDNGFVPFLFWSGRSNNKLFLKSAYFSHRLNLKINSAHYDNFRFIGWVEKKNHQ